MCEYGSPPITAGRTGLAGRGLLSVVQVASDDSLQVVEPESGFHGGHDVGRLKARVGVDDETSRKLFVAIRPRGHSSYSVAAI